MGALGRAVCETVVGSGRGEAERDGAESPCGGNLGWGA